MLRAGWPPVGWASFAEVSCVLAGLPSQQSDCPPAGWLPLAAPAGARPSRRQKGLGPGGGQGQGQSDAHLPAAFSFSRGRRWGWLVWASASASAGGSCRLLGLPGRRGRGAAGGDAGLPHWAVGLSLGTRGSPWAFWSAPRGGRTPLEGPAGGRGQPGGPVLVLPQTLTEGGHCGGLSSWGAGALVGGARRVVLGKWGGCGGGGRTQQPGAQQAPALLLGDNPGPRSGSGVTTLGPAPALEGLWRQQSRCHPLSPEGSAHIRAPPRLWAPLLPHVQSVALGPGPSGRSTGEAA